MHPTGLITALATPFDEAGALDLDAWRRLLQWQLARGVQGLVVAGSTGEAAMLEDAEYDALLRLAVETVAGRVAIGAEARLVLDAAPSLVIPAQVHYVGMGLDLARTAHL